jgi:hypothetical protein
MCAQFRAFGLGIEADFPLAGTRSAEEKPFAADLRIDLEPAEGLWSGPAGQPLWSPSIDGCDVALERGLAGDHLISYGERARFWLSPQVDRVCCAPADRDDPAWQRFLLDTVLLVASLLRGFHALHASAVDHDGALLAFAAVMGGGKSSLVAELIERGDALFCDDILTLEARDGGVIAHPGPPLMNLPRAHPAAGIGERLGSFGDEDWLEVTSASTRSLSPDAIFLLERGVRFGPTEVSRLEPNPMHLAPHALGLEGGFSPGRSRFTILADLVSQAPLYRLRAGLDEPPSAIADGVLEAVREPAVVA